MRIKYFVGAFFLLAIPTGAFAQYDSIVNRMQKEFDAFKKGIEQEHRQFKAKNDSLFSVFLRESWESFDVFFKPKPEEKPKPVLQPVVPLVPIPQIIPQKISPADTVKTGNISAPVKIDIRAQISEPKPEYEKMGALPVSLEFYGSSPSLLLPTGFPHVKQLTGKEIARFFDDVAPSIQVSQLLLQLSVLKKTLHLNDWGYYKLTEATSRKIYESPSEQVLLVWVLLLKSGYNVKIGYSDMQVYLMFPSIHENFDSWYLTINNTVFYIVSGQTENKALPELTVHKADYPGSRAFSMRLLQLPELGKKVVQKEIVFRDKTFTLTLDLNLVKFYEEYPSCNLEIYFSAPFSNIATQSIDSFFIPVLSGLTPQQRITTLLEFTQKSFAYKTDKEQFGREKFFFPDELFYYPFSDCEDRAVFFAWLVRHFTGLPCAGLEYSNHVTTAVLLSGSVPGSKILINGQQYTICDPTYWNAPIGYLAEEYQDITPRIITFD